MKEYFKGNVDPAYETDNEILILGDTFSVLKKIKPCSIDMIFADVSVGLN